MATGHAGGLPVVLRLSRLARPGGPSRNLPWNAAKALGRLVAVVGSAVALKELFLVLSVHCKQLASSAGERVLEVG